MLRPVPWVTAAGLAVVLLWPGPGWAEDTRFLESRPSVLVDGTGRTLGQAFPVSAAEVGGVLARMRIGSRDLLLGATPDRLDVARQGQLAFGTSDCTGDSWFVPYEDSSYVFAPVTTGFGTAVFAPDGPAEEVVINALLDPATRICQPTGIFTVLQPAIQILDLASFPPPYTVR